MIEKEPPPHNTVKEQFIWVAVIVIATLAIATVLALLIGCASPQEPRRTIAGKSEGQCRTLARITFYTGTHERVAATGKRAVEGKSAAAHPKYPFATQIKIPSLYQYLGDDTFTIEDRGSAVTSRKASRGRADVFDIFVSNRKTMNRLSKDAPEYMEVIQL